MIFNKALSSEEVETLYDYDFFSVGWDKNGNIASNDFAKPSKLTYTFNWDNKLRKAEWPTDSSSIEIKYDPLGNRVWKKYTSGSPPVETERKYVVDITGKLPVILMELNSSGGIVKTYIYANSEIIAQHDGDNEGDIYFYLHDRLGSVRLVIDDQGSVENSYTYEPFGEMFATECTETTENPFKFTGQYFDSEIEEYYLRARQYNPHIARFTSRDPVFGKPYEPMTLHLYLYCGNDPANYIDPDGRVAVLFGGSLSGNITAYDLASGFSNIPGMRGIAAMAVYYSAILPVSTMVADDLIMGASHVGWGATIGAGYVVAWDHTRGLRSLNDSDAWSWGSIQWAGVGYSVATGKGGSITLDVGVSNATHVSQLAGAFVEGGGSGKTPFWGGLAMGGTLSRGVNEDGSWNDIWLGTYSVGGASKGAEGHVYAGVAFVQERAGW